MTTRRRKRSNGTEVKLTFLGAAETVTGSRFLVESGESPVLVDCGLFQGVKRIRQQNWKPFPVEPASIDAVVLTHAHLDHSGFLPALARDGFTGPVWCTDATAELLGLLLPDSAYLQEEDARFANRHQSSKHTPALPLYTGEDAELALNLVRPVRRHHEFTPAAGITAELLNAGHILGSSSVKLSTDGTSVLFSGDVGRPQDRVMKGPERPPKVNYVVTESTYGNRRHTQADASDELGAVIDRTLRRGGTVLIPSFAVGRAQTVLTLIEDLKEQGRIPDVGVYLNSPMSIHATESFLAHPEEHRLSPKESKRLRAGVTLVRTADDSKELTRRRDPMIIISASGMATGGRILHHLRGLAPDPRNSIIFVGYQAAGTRGAALVGGAEEIKIFGDYVDVQAEVVSLGGLSAHADQAELLDWLASGEFTPKRCFVVHGEPEATDEFRRRLVDRLGWDAQVPVQGETIELL